MAASAPPAPPLSSALLVLQNQRGDRWFAEPALELWNIFQQDVSGAWCRKDLGGGPADAVIRLHVTLLLWLLSELFQQLHEVSHPDRPRLALLFNEAHLLFNSAPKVLVDKVERASNLLQRR